MGDDVGQRGGAEVGICHLSCVRLPWGGWRSWVTGEVELKGSVYDTYREYVVDVAMLLYDGCIDVYV